MKVKDIKPGYVFFDVIRFEPSKFLYMGIMQRENIELMKEEKTYHIVIKNAQPLKIYHDELQRILDKNLRTYEDAKVAVKNNLQSWLGEFDNMY